MTSCSAASCPVQSDPVTDASIVELRALVEALTATVHEQNTRIDGDDNIVAKHAQHVAQYKEEVRAEVWTVNAAAWCHRLPTPCADSVCASGAAATD